MLNCETSLLSEEIGDSKVPKPSHTAMKPHLRLIFLPASQLQDSVNDANTVIVPQ